MSLSSTKHPRGAMFWLFLPFVYALLLFPAGTLADPQQALALPAILQGKAVVLQPLASNYPKANIGAAIKAPGLGGISNGIVIQLKQDLPVYRMWNGPGIVNEQGFTNRIGSWWSYDRPSGSRKDYREHYEVCEGWNELNYVASCTLEKGAVVAIGPGQSVSAKTCDKPGESYPAQAQYWQVYVDKAWSRTATLNCPPEDDDYAANPDNIAQSEK